MADFLLFLPFILQARLRQRAGRKPLPQALAASLGRKP
jgi:hypothetical protein